MVHAIAGQSSQILCHWLGKHGSAVSRWSRKGSLSRAYDPLRSKTNMVISLVLLQGTVKLQIHSGKAGWYTCGRCYFRVLEYLDQVRHWNMCMEL